LFSPRHRPDCTHHLDLSRVHSTPGFKFVLTKGFGLLSPATAPAVAAPAISPALGPSTCSVFWPIPSVVTFYWHWKHLAILAGQTCLINESNTKSDGWFRGLNLCSTAPSLNQRLQPVSDEQLWLSGPWMSSSVTWSRQDSVPDLLEGRLGRIGSRHRLAHQRHTARQQVCWRDNRCTLDRQPVWWSGAHSLGYILT